MKSLTIVFKSHTGKNEFPISYPIPGMVSRIIISNKAPIDHIVKFLEQRYSKISELTMKDALPGDNTSVELLGAVITTFPHLTSLNLNCVLYKPAQIDSMMSQLPASLRSLAIDGLSLLSVSTADSNHMIHWFQRIQIQCPHLTTLTMPNCQFNTTPEISQELLTHLPATLSHFDVRASSFTLGSHQELTAFIDKVFVHFPSLRSFALTIDNKWSEADKVALLQNLIARSQLTSLHLPCTSLSDPLWQELIRGLNQRSLESIDFMRNEGSGKLTLLFQSISKVNTIHFSMSAWGIPKLTAALASIPSAISLILKENNIHNITQELVNAFAQIENLRCIDLRGNFNTVLDNYQVSDSFQLSEAFLQLISQYHVTLDEDFFNYPCFDSRKKLEEFLQVLPRHITLSLADNAFNYRDLRKLLLNKIMVYLLDEMEDQLKKIENRPLKTSLKEPMLWLKSHFNMGSHVFDSPAALHAHWKNYFSSFVTESSCNFFPRVNEVFSEIDNHIEELTGDLGLKEGLVYTKSALK